MKATPFGSLGVLAALVGFAGATSCSVDHRTDEFQCENQSDCHNGRVCQDGFCVQTGPGVPDASDIDGANQDVDASRCPPGCTTCDPAGKTCIINCMVENCTNEVVCPQGWHCDVRCNVQNSCRNGVNCLGGASCAVTCSGTSSCRAVQCGPGRCAVMCSGQNACRGVYCGSSCACDVFCSGTGSCADTVQCNMASLACDTGLGCTSIPPGCSSCAN